MGLLVSIYRSDYDSVANVFAGKKKLVVTNVDGPFDPTPDAPAAILTTNGLGNPIVVPADPPGDGKVIGPMDGGAYASTSDSRWSDAIRKIAGHSIYAALPIHDRYDTVADYRAFSI